MKNGMKKEMENGMKGTAATKQLKRTNGLVTLGNLLNKHSGLIICALIVIFMSVGAAQAGPDAETLWSKVADLIQKWVTRLGGVIMFIGGIMFGLGWKNDDAEGKSRGITTLIAGGIVIAVAALTGTFFA